MKQVLVFAIFISIVGYGLYTVVNLYDDNMKWSRMHNTPVIRPHENPLLIMEEGVVPIDGGEAVVRASLGDADNNPEQQATPSTIAFGVTEYQAFCSHCHGIDLDGQGTVGQSFQPLPTNLTSQRVIGMKDSDIFRHVSYGGVKSPPLASTMTVQSRWAVIQYIRSRQNPN